MTPLSRLAAARPGLVAALLALLLAVRLLLPAGTMIGPDAAGRAAVVLCPGTMPMATAGHHGHHRPAERPDGDGRIPCAFAALATLLLGPADPPPLPAAAPAPIAAPMVAIARDGPSPDPAPRPPARAPPVA